MHYTYVLQSTKDEKFYVGFTKNLKLRFEQHNKGMVESAKNRRPLSIIYYEACISKDDALRMEKYLKTYHGRIFIKRRLKSYLTGYKGDELGTDKQSVNFFYTARGSSAEVQTQAIIAFEIGYLNQKNFDFIENESQGISKMLNKLIQSRSNK